MSDDYYSILGITKEASEAQIKDAYRKMALKYHPDRNPGDKKAEDMFKKAAEAYDVLKDPQKKAQYDQFGQAGASGNQYQYSGGFSDVEDIFKHFGDIFGGSSRESIFDEFFSGSSRQRSSRRQKGSDLRYNLEIPLKEAFKGVEKKIEFESEVHCESCNGSGSDPKYAPKRCNACGGSGQTQYQSQGFFNIRTSCSACGGKGEIHPKACEECKGVGRKMKLKKLKVNIPKGVKSGTRLRIMDEGEGGYRGGKAGDLYIFIDVLKDKKVSRKLNDLICDLKISYLQALLGCELKVKIWDEYYEVKIPSCSQNGDSLVQKSKGMPVLNEDQKGDLVFQIWVEIPKKMNAKEEKLLREIAEEKGEKVSKSSSFKFF